MDEDEKQAALDWLYGRELDLQAAARRLDDLRQWLVQDDVVLREENLEDLEAFGNRLLADVARFKQRLAVT